MISKETSNQIMENKQFLDGWYDFVTVERFEDDPRSGQPITKYIQENIEAILINEDPHSTYDDIEVLTSLSNGTIFSIIIGSVKLWKVTSRWVPHFLTEQKRKERVEACRENLRMFNKGKVAII